MNPERANGTAIDAVHLLDCAPSARHGSSAAAALRLEEEGEFYVPELLADEDYEPRPGVYDAADEHARSLHEAGRCVDEALHLADVLRAAMGDAGDRRAMQVDTVLTIVAEKLGRAQARIDAHDANHTNLFMAYFELRHR